MKSKMVFVSTAILIISISMFVLAKQPTADQIGEEFVSDPKNTSYIIEGKSVTLIKGKSTSTGAAGEEIQTQTFGEPIYGDFDKDGKNEAVIYLTQSTGGSGTFFYAAGAEEINGEWKGTNTIFLGDRISPQNINIIDGVANFNFATRRPSESFATSPSEGTTKRFVVAEGQLIEK